LSNLILRWRDSEVLKGRLLAVEARAAHDRFGLTHTGIVRVARTISKAIQPSVSSSTGLALRTERRFHAQLSCLHSRKVRAFSMIVANSVY
jgi:hypothetical protein